MDSSTINIVVLVLILVLCCGPMIFMMGRHGNGEGGGKGDSGKTGKPSGDGEPK